ncbi:hypothetical protein MOQ_002582 [Trypanosoma cruzi marinkellei]|uniref:Uncharacterized protein n=1 Tax=Trypanosoma cruzi marinkellei TaxID=85056 RepID=K2N6H0_TRYCR|nr:hypothetical protein MOQ_002582 [Trypanosoma cruzi marinkellei]
MRFALTIFFLFLCLHFLASVTGGLGSRLLWRRGGGKEGVMQAVVHYGEQFVEVPDASVTLKDICGSFGLTGDLAGVCIKHRATGRVVATLPFECLPAANDAEGEEDKIYEVCVPSEGGVGDATPTTDDMTDILRQLVQLGATSLLSTESELHRSLDPYDPRMSPGLLMRTIYPPSLYSPYRHRGDPLNMQGRIANSPITGQMAGPPYMSAVEPYTVEAPTEMTLQLRPDLVPQSEEEARDILQGLVAAATQVKAMMAMADEEEKRHAPSDVKPNVALMQMN